MTCIITGCTAMNREGAWVGGDLFRIGDCYVFNSILNDETGQTAWRYQGTPFYSKLIVLKYYFERRGVLVAKVTDCDLNTAAEEYIRG